MNSVTIESTKCKTDLCELCSLFNTDKGPFTKGEETHRHPYTTPYSLFFESLRHKPIKFAEIGVYRGASLLVWRTFFSKARLYGYDKDEVNLDHIRQLDLSSCFLGVIDAGKKASLDCIFTEATEDGELFDVIIDDASHEPAHQAEVIRTVLPYLKQGGVLIIEDIFRDCPETIFEEALQTVKNQVGFSTFIMCEHENRRSFGWNNDKMLVIVRS